jgi:RHS repeat-associated protein
MGQHVQSRIYKDQLGRPTFEVDDPYHRLVSQEIYEGNKKYSSIQFEYDACGQILKQRAQVMTNGQPLREYTIERTYNSRGFLTSETEMPSGKTTKYTYDSLGRLIQRQKPDGVSLNYTYDALGRLKEMSSTDGTVKYTYDYDLHDNPIQIQDLVHHTHQKRTYDILSRLIEEELSLDLTVHYEYDDLNRLTQMTLPDGSYVLYTYDSFYLIKAERFDPFGLLLYDYKCQAYDLQGNLLRTLSPAGEVKYTYDLLGRAIEVKTPHWESHLQNFDPVGNLLTMKQKSPIGNSHEQFSYDRFNHLTTEAANKYEYDSIGNCLKKNDQTQEINTLNQVLKSGSTQYSYDPNGNLVTQASITYKYDALNRLTTCEKDGQKTTFTYDAFGRCLQIEDQNGTKQLIYQKEQEIGSLSEGKIREYRLVHPNPNHDLTFAIELNKEVFFPIQDTRSNICALQKKNGSLSQWIQYTAFGTKTISGEKRLINNPWWFANRREVCGLSLFTHRFYNPEIMRWQTTDPLGFQDGLNLYAYVHNNPFFYRDQKGQFAILFYFLIGTFALGEEVIFGFMTWKMIGEAVALAAVAWAGTEANKAYKAHRQRNAEEAKPDDSSQKEEEKRNQVEEQEKKKGRRRGKDNESRGGPPRDRLGNYSPDPAAEGPHTTLGTRDSPTTGPYVQGATFDEHGKFQGRTDLTDHGRRDHPNPHYHPATGPDSAKSPPEIIPWLEY